MIYESYEISEAITLYWSTATPIHIALSMAVSTSYPELHICDRDHVAWEA
jgi:hypothetical protein